MRPVEKWRWPYTVSFRTTSQDKAKIDRLSAKQNLTPSEFLRDGLNKLLENGNQDKTGKER